MILGIIVILEPNPIDTGLMEATMRRTGPKTELVASMRNMDTGVSILGLMSAGLTEDMESDILTTVLKNRIHFLVEDAISVMVMVTTTIGTPSRKSSLGWNCDRALIQIAIVTSRCSSMILMTIMSRSPMMETLELVASKDVDLENTATATRLEISALEMEASTTFTQVFRLSMNLIARATMTPYDQGGPNKLAMDVHTTMY